MEFNPTFCRLLRTRYPEATVVQGDAYSIKRLLGSLLRHPAAAVVSGLPLFTKPLRFRLRLLADALRSARIAPGFLASIEVTLVESNPRLREIQKETLKEISAPLAWSENCDSV